MPSHKFKPHKGIKKRVRISSTGKVKRARAGLGHLCSHKSGARKRKLRRATICPPMEAKRVRNMIGQ